MTTPTTQRPVSLSDEVTVHGGASAGSPDPRDRYRTPAEIVTDVLEGCGLRSYGRTRTLPPGSATFRVAVG